VTGFWRQLAAGGSLPNFAKITIMNPMTTMNISLPDSLKTFVDEEVGRRGYGACSEYVRELIRKDRDRQQLRALLLAGGASAPTVPIDASYFDGLREIVKTARS
jgi:antitoxin ParD1/3/4